jgi:hypothetical protein
MPLNFDIHSISRSPRVQTLSARDGPTNMPSPAEQSDCRPKIPNYDEIFSRPLLPPDPQTFHPKPNFIYRHRNSLWWFVIFAILFASAAVLYTWDSGMIAESGCG